MWIYWFGQKVHSGFSVPFYGKLQTNFWPTQYIWNHWSFPEFPPAPWKAILSVPPMPSSQADTSLLSVTVVSFDFLQFCLIESCSMYFLLDVSLRMILRCFHVSSCLICTFLLTAEFHSIVWIDCYFIYLFFKSIYLLWAISSLGILQIMLLWTFTCKSLYGSLLSFLLSKYLGFGWLHHMVCIYELLKKPLNHFSK